MISYFFSLGSKAEELINEEEENKSTFCNNQTVNIIIMTFFWLYPVGLLLFGYVSQMHEFNFQNGINFNYSNHLSCFQTFFPILLFAFVFTSAKYSRHFILLSFVVLEFRLVGSTSNIVVCSGIFTNNFDASVVHMS